MATAMKAPTAPAALPLAMRANFVWTLAFRARHDANWGRLLDARNTISRFARDPNPRIRALALSFLPADNRSIPA